MHTDARAPHLLLVALLVVELGLEAKGLALVLGQLVGFPRLLLPLPLKVVQPEAMAAQQDPGASARRGAPLLGRAKRRQVQNYAVARGAAARGLPLHAPLPG